MKKWAKSAGSEKRSPYRRDGRSAATRRKKGHWGRVSLQKWARWQSIVWMADGWGDWVGGWAFLGGRRFGKQTGRQNFLKQTGSRAIRASQPRSTPAGRKPVGEGLIRPPRGASRHSPGTQACGCLAAGSGPSRARGHLVWGVAGNLEIWRNCGDLSGFGNLGALGNRCGWEIRLGSVVKSLVGVKKGVVGKKCGKERGKREQKG